MFHVPELSRVSPAMHPMLGTTATDGNNGAFFIESPEPGWQLALICSDGSDPDVPEADGWEHVSVHAFRGPRARTPTWREMTHVKRLCWDGADVVMQLHPKEVDYVNVHPHVLHLWRPRHLPVPLPPLVCV